jgi:hypothetical protein
MKKMLILLISISLLAGCKKKSAQNEEGQNTQAKFKEGVVLHKTYYYKDSTLKAYAGALNRGQKILTESTSVVVEQPEHRRKVEAVRIKLPSEDKIFYAISSYLFPSGYKLVCTYDTSRTIMKINKDTYKYKNQDIHSPRTKIKAGIKVILIEKKYDWSHIHTANAFWWVKNEDLSSEDADVQIKVTVPDVGTTHVESSSSYAPEIGNERLFSPDLAFDASLNTFWLSSPDAENIGQWVKLNFASGREDQFSLSIINGNSKSEEDYKKYSRVKRIRVETDTQNVTVDLAEDYQKYQELGNFKGTFVKLTVLSVFEGTSKMVAIGSVKIKSVSQNSTPSTGGREQSDSNTPPNQ